MRHERFAYVAIVALVLAGTGCKEKSSTDEDTGTDTSPGDVIEEQDVVEETVEDVPVEDVQEEEVVDPPTVCETLGLTERDFVD